MGIMSLAEIMDTSIEILRKHIKSIIVYIIAFGAICFAAFIGAAVFTGIAAIVTGGLAAIILIPAFIFLGIVVFLTMEVGIIKITGQEYFKQKVEAAEALKASFKSIFKVSGITAIIVLISIPVTVVFGGLLYFMFTVLESPLDALAEYDWGILLIVILFILLGLAIAGMVIAYFTVFAFSLHAAVLEEMSVLRSIKRSWTLVRYNFWKVFGCIILFYLSVLAVQLTIGSFVSIISSLIYLLLKLLNITQDYLAFFTFIYGRIEGPLNIVSGAIIGPITSIMISLLYFNQRFKKEGLDMRVRLREIQYNEERK